MTMTKLGRIAPLAAIAVAVGFAATAEAAEITVFRGGATEVVDSARSGGTTVLRGSGPTKKAGAGPAVQISIQMPGGAVAGRKLWTTDRNGHLRVCSAHGTSRVGETRISCTTAR